MNLTDAVFKKKLTRLLEISVDLVANWRSKINSEITDDLASKKLEHLLSKAFWF